MLSSGLDEIITTSLIGKPLLDKYMQTFDETKAVKVHNSASDESTMLRTTTTHKKLFGLMKSVKPIS